VNPGLSGRERDLLTQEKPNRIWQTGLTVDARWEATDRRRQKL